MLYSITIDKDFYNDNEDMLKNERTTMYFHSITELGKKLAELENIIYCCEYAQIECHEDYYVQYSMSIDKLNDKGLAVSHVVISNPYL